MIGVDTNVLVRLFVEEDTPQAAAAISFFNARSASDPAYISLLVIAELAWVLGSIYKFGHDRIGAVIEELLNISDVIVERADLVKWAVDRFDHPKVDLADLLIAEANKQAKCRSTATFDREAAKRIPGMELLA